MTWMVLTNLKLLAQRSGYEIWDVTDVRTPRPVAALLGIRNTHKLW